MAARNPVALEEAMHPIAGVAEAASEVLEAETFIPIGSTDLFDFWLRPAPSMPRKAELAHVGVHGELRNAESDPDLLDAYPARHASADFLAGRHGRPPPPRPAMLVGTTIPTQERGHPRSLVRDGSAHGSNEPDLVGPPRYHHADDLLTWWRAARTLDSMGDAQTVKVTNAVADGCRFSVGELNATVVPRGGDASLAVEERSQPALRVGEIIHVSF